MLSPHQKKIFKCNKWNPKISSVFCNRLSIIGIGLVWWASLELFAFIFCSTLWCIGNVLCIALSLMINIYILHLCLFQILIKTQKIWKYKRICMKYEELTKTNELNLPYKATVGAAFGCRSIYSLPLFVPQRCGA